MSAAVMRRRREKLMKKCPMSFCVFNGAKFVGDRRSWAEETMRRIVERKCRETRWSYWGSEYVFGSVMKME